MSEEITLQYTHEASRKKLLKESFRKLMNI